MQIISAPDAPAAIGPYVHATAFERLVFTSGQIPLRSDGTMVEGGIVEQTEQVLRNLEAILIAAGSSLDRVFKTTVYLLDLSEFASFNQAYEAAFGSHHPARSTVQVARLPRDARVEIEVIALR